MLPRTVLGLLCALNFLHWSAASTGFQGQSSAATTKTTSNDDVWHSESSSQSNVEIIDDTVKDKNASDASILPEWRKRLPSELQSKTRTLQRIIVPGRDGCHVELYLLGTAHVSNDSSRDVRMLLEAVDPNVLFLELCDQRIPMMLTPPPPPPPQSTEVDHLLGEGRSNQGLWKRMQTHFKRTTERKNQEPPPEGSRSMYGVAAGLLTNMQQNYAESLGVELGGEFRVAFNYWEENRRRRNIHMVLGDRPLYLTLSRAWQSLGLWGKTKLVVSLVISSFQKPDPEELRAWMQKILSDDTGDLLTESIAELAKHFPALERVIIQERDTYMACKLYQTCRSLLQPSRLTYIEQDAKIHKLVAIVGAGHVPGICKLLTEGNGKQPEEMLAPLIELKKPIPAEDRQTLISDVMELNAEVLKSIADEMHAGHTG